MNLGRPDEATFGFKGLVPYFQIGQHTRSLMVLNAIAAFLQSLPKGFKFTLNSLPPVVSSSLNKTTSVSVITINSIDAFPKTVWSLLPLCGRRDKSLQGRDHTEYGTTILCFSYWICHSKLENL